MEPSAFARSKQFLDYHPLPKWLSIVASIGAGFLFVGLLAILGLFIDLMVNGGEIPGYHQLTDTDRSHFLRHVALREDLDPKERERIVSRFHAHLQELGFDMIDLADWEKGESADKWRTRETALLWWGAVAELIETQVGSVAVQRLAHEMKSSIAKNGADAALYQPVRDVGVLGVVIRERHSFDGGLFGFLAGHNEWTWKYGNTTYLFGLLLIAMLVAGVRLLLLFLSNFLAARAVLGAVTRLRRAVYLHTHRLGILAFRALGPSEAVSVATRHLEGVHEGLFQWLTGYFRAPVKFVLLLVFALLVNFWLALAFLLFAVLIWLIGGQIAAVFRKQSRDAETSAADFLALFQESLMLIRLVKIYLMEGYHQTRVDSHLAGYSQAQLLRYRAEAIYRPVIYFLCLAAALALLFVAGYVVLLGRLGVPSTMLLAISILTMYWPAMAFLDARRAVRQSRASAKALFGFLDKQGSVGQAIEASFLPPMTKVMQFDKVSLPEPGTGRKLLENISFTIRAGTRIAIVGPDELEKHALVYLLPRFLDPSNGEIRIDGKNLRWVTLDSLRTQIAMVLQHNLVFNDTVMNNIGCGDGAYSLARIMEAAKLAHAHQFITKLPKGYETPIGDMGHALKLGEQFRVALARAILRDPAILVIEEPSIPMDEDTKAMVDDTIQRVLVGRTMIFLPHRLSTIRACDQILVLFQGAVQAVGEHRELLANSELYRHLQYIEFNEFAGLRTPPADEKA